MVIYFESAIVSYVNSLYETDTCQQSWVLAQMNRRTIQPPIDQLYFLTKC